MQELCTNCHTAQIYDPTKRLKVVPPLCLNCFLKAWGYVRYSADRITELMNEGLAVEAAADIVGKELTDEIDKLPMSAANSIGHLIDTISEWQKAQDARPANVSDLKRKAR